MIRAIGMMSLEIFSLFPPGIPGKPVRLLSRTMSFHQKIFLPCMIPIVWFAQFSESSRVERMSDENSMLGRGRNSVPAVLGLGLKMKISAAKASISLKAQLELSQAPELIMGLKFAGELGKSDAVKFCDPTGLHFLRGQNLFG